MRFTDLMLSRGILTFDPNSWKINGAISGIKDPNISPDGLQTISFDLKNTGKNPVYIMQATYEFKVAEELPPIPLSNPIRVPDIPGLFGQGFSIREVIPGLAITQSDAHEIAAGKKYAFLRIVIFYLDHANWRYEYRITARYGKRVAPNGSTEFGFEFPDENVTRNPISLDYKDIVADWLSANRKSGIKWRSYNYIVARCPQGSHYDCPIPDQSK